MPPLIPLRRAISALAPSNLIRPFSSTALVSAPDEPSTTAADAASPAAAPSSSGKLLSLQQQNQNWRSERIGTNPRARSEAARRIAERFRDRANVTQRTRQAQVDVLRERKMSADYLRQIPRKFRPGDVYSPHDLSSKEMTKWRKWKPRTDDVVDTLGLRPLDMYKNFSLIQEFTTSSGMILSSKSTGLRPVNQRKIAKMIRRVQGMGLYPTIHDHPEMIRNQFFQPERDRR